MLRYISISLLLLISVASWSQTIVKEQSSVNQGITVGVNLAGFVNRIIDNDRTGISFLSRVNLNSNLFVAAEAGYENVSFEKSAYNYFSNGTFFKIGLEKDMLPDKEKGTNDNILIGLHYGFALQEQGSDYFFVENGYWDDYSGRLGTNTLNTHWLELSAGPRAELFKNVYMSWGMHFRVAVATSNTSIMEPYIIPGFGSGDKRVNLGFSYSIEYMIPWNRK